MTDQFLESRLARLESDVARIRSDIEERKLMRKLLLDNLPELLLTVLLFVALARGL